MFNVDNSLKRATSNREKENVKVNAENLSSSPFVISVHLGSEMGQHTTFEVTRLKPLAYK